MGFIPFVSFVPEAADRKSTVPALTEVESS
jgi:hypothetical protein